LDTETTIVGAGPYGLSIAAHLRAQRKSFEVLGTPLESWRKFMPTGMVLKSEPFASNLWDPQRRFTLQRYCESHGKPYQRVADPVALSHFLEYADWFREQAVGAVRDVRVAKLSRRAQGFDVQLTDGTHFSSRRVVLATGHMAFRTIPPELQSLPEPLALHSARIADVGSYANRDVCIIGAGQSALETAALLHEAGARVRIIVRRPQVGWNPEARLRPLSQQVVAPDAGVGSGWSSVAISELPRFYRWYFPPPKRHRFLVGSYGPSGSWWLRDRIQGKIEILLNSRVLAAGPENGGVRLKLEGPQEPFDVHADHVIAGTGYRVDIQKMEYLEPSLREAIALEAPGIPALDSHFESSVPGLFIVGLASAPVFGPIMRFMYGAKHPAAVVTRRLS